MERKICPVPGKMQHQSAPPQADDRFALQQKLQGQQEGSVSAVFSLKDRWLQVTSSGA